MTLNINDTLYFVTELTICVTELTLCLIYKMSVLSSVHGEFVVGRFVLKMVQAQSTARFIAGPIKVSKPLCSVFEQHFRSSTLTKIIGASSARCIPTHSMTGRCYVSPDELYYPRQSQFMLSHHLDQFDIDHIATSSRAFESFKVSCTCS